MKFIAILLVVVSSSKLTYHQIDKTNNLCSLIVFDDSDCSGLKDELDKQEFVAGLCPGTPETSCDPSQDQAVKTFQSIWKFVLSGFCHWNQDLVEFDYKCFQPSDEPVDEPSDEPVDEPSDEPVDEPTQARIMETYHLVESAGQPCAYVEFDVNKCPGVKDALMLEQFSSGACPSTYAKTSCEDQDKEPKADEVASRKLALGEICDDFTYEIACEPRMKTFHKIDASSGLCEYVDFDRFECNGLADYLENEPSFLPGPCPDTHDQSHCTASKEMDFARAAWTGVYSVYCNVDLDDVEYGYACEEGRGAPKCPEACANAIAADSATGAALDNGSDATGMCSGIFNELQKGHSHDFPVACSDLGETTLGLCMTELYEKCVTDVELLTCPIPDYGFPYVLRDCKPKTCGEWKEAVDTGCAKEVSACIKDELQGNLKCTMDGKDLTRSSADSCDNTLPCTKLGEFCNFDNDLKRGKCELCSHSLCALLTNEKAKAECLRACGEDDCTTGLGCDDSCERPAETCTQLKNMMENVNSCGKTCNQCHVDVLNARLQCDGKYKVQSRIDGDSANALSILMLASIAIFLWI